MFEPKTLDQAIAPMLMMNIICGVGIFKNPNDRLTRCLEFIYSGCYLPIFLYSYKYFTEFYDNLYYLNVFILNRVIINNSIKITAVVLIVLVVAGRINAKKIRNLIALFDDYDQGMEKMGLPRQYCVMYRYQLYSFAASKLLIFTFATVFYTKYLPPMLPWQKKMFITFAFHFPLLLISVCAISFCMWVRCLKLRFQQLNGLLQNIEITKPDLSQEKKILTMFYDFDNKTFSSFEEKNIQKSKGNALTMRLAKQAHLELIKIASATNATYGVQLLLLTISACGTLFGCIFAIYRILWLDFKTIDTLRYMLPSLMPICFFGLEILLVGYTCARTSNEAARAGDVICRFCKPCDSKEFRAEIRDFTLQLVQNHLTFTACGFFNVDHSFILKITGSIIAYLVVVIQVGDMTTRSYRKFLEKNVTFERDLPISCNDFNMNCTFKDNWY